MVTYKFEGATAFNSDISGWNVGGVTNMQGMVSEADYVGNRTCVVDS